MRAGAVHLSVLLRQRHGAHRVAIGHAERLRGVGQEREAVDARRRVRHDNPEIRKAAIAMNVPLLTTLSAAMAAVSAIQALGKKELRYRSLQSHFENGNQ